VKLTEKEARLVIDAIELAVKFMPPSKKRTEVYSMIPKLKTAARIK
jgi:uncharacterized protein (DUF2249 family)